MLVRKIGRCILFLLLSVCVVEIIYLYSTGLYPPAENIYESLERKDLLSSRQGREVIHNSSSDDSNLILLWGKRWNGREDWPPEGYKWDECLITYDRKRISEARAIVFHSTTIKVADFPWRYERKPDQIYIWWNSETSASVLKELELAGESIEPYNSGFLNWTMTYRLDADVVWGYGYRGDILQEVSRGKSTTDKIISEKQHLAMWVASNCKYTTSAKQRMLYVEDMIAAGLNITKAGSCFKNQLSREELNNAVKKHKFYFAFENALHCRDYITEKFWQIALQNNAVPVVMGPLKEDVLRVAPLDSFIHVDDYNSPADLVKYLQYLDKNADEYRKYFYWRENEDITDEKMIQSIEEKYPHIKPQRRPKGLCESVLKNKKIKTILSLSHEIYANEPKECLRN